MNRFLLAFLSVFIFAVFIFSAQAQAAAPDGAGPWADFVSGFNQGLTKSAGPVPAPRSDPNSALGVAENDTVEPHFVSLGFGGQLTLGFDNGFQSALIVFEATNPGYPVETASVEVSGDGVTWFPAGSVSQDGQVNVPSALTCARFVRITDTSNPADFAESTADAFDVDGVQTTGDSCTPPPCAPSCCPSTTVNVSGNGTGSTNTTIVKNKNLKSTTQKTTKSTNTGITSKALTGKVKVKKNTGGSTTVLTGNSLSAVFSSVLGGSNTAN